MKTPTKITLTVVYELAIFYGMFFVLHKLMSYYSWWSFPTGFLLIVTWIFLGSAGIALATEDGL